MLQQFFKSVGRIYTFVMSVVLTAILGIATWFCWELYQDSLLQRQFTEGGQLVSVKIYEGQQGQRSWRDILSNTTYLTFSYRGKSYTTRYVMSDSYVGSGDQVQLLYHPQYGSGSFYPPTQLSTEFTKPSLVAVVRL